MFGLNLDVDNLDIDKLDIKNEQTVEDIIDEKIKSNRVKSIAKRMAIKIKDDENEENSLQNLDFLLNIPNFDKIIKHTGRVFNTGMLDNLKYDTYVYSIDNTHVLKIINCDCNAMESYMIIKELAYQEYAKELSNVCDFETPTILNYGRIMLNENIRKNPKYRDFLDDYTYDCIWFIVMNKMNYKSLSEGVADIDLDDKATCNELSEKINNVRKCMETHGLFHNDYHSENILIDTENDNKIGIIDFGLADTENADQVGIVDFGFEKYNDTGSSKDTNEFDTMNGENDFLRNWEYTCDKLIALKRKSDLKSPTGVSNISENEYGGSKKKNRKTIRQKHRNPIRRTKHRKPIRRTKHRKEHTKRNKTRNRK
jgi:hypothetical protein